MTITSPCINVCVTDPDTDLCYGVQEHQKKLKNGQNITMKNS